ncbi:Spindle assembly checkpoint kinase [Thelohanellus kitauei]|uniref:Spindle assembly checkpoint kinase n=1 Tax=Thelohanellus kitauei TaxID=669202 RepID=A0A0C2IIA2_THEKT|nr:Spindle assembly checkpoint kinase [Thelohanellus kitauei]
MYFRSRKLFTLNETKNFSPDVSDADLLKDYGLEMEKFLANGSYSKAPIYVMKYKDQRVAVKASRLIGNKITKHAKSEMEVVKRIEHPNIVYHFAYFKSGGRIFCVMEYLPDGTLGSYIKSRPPPSTFCIRVVFYQILRAMNYLHRNLIAHRDIKDENIVMKFNMGGAPPIAKLCDFGFAIQLPHKDAEVDVFCGTRTFKAPEILHAEGSYNPFMSDTWALGILLFKMVTRKVPAYSVETRKLTIDLGTLSKGTQTENKPIGEDRVGKTYPGVLVDA